MPFQKGHNGKHVGRAKGTPNKSTAKYQDDQDWVYEHLGGREGWLAFAEKNPLNKAQFYKGIEKRIPPAPVDVGVSGQIDHTVNVKITVVDTKG